MALPPVVPTKGLRSIQPVGIGLREWADRTVGIVQKYGFRQRLMDDDWVKWGMSLLTVLARTKGGQIPRADQFKDWREWAVRINRVIEQ